VSIPTASCTHHRRIGKYKKQLKLSQSELHKELGFVAAQTGNHGGRNELMQAIRHCNHTLSTQDVQSCLYKVC
jgi:hypothetical protein